MLNRFAEFIGQHRHWFGGPFIVILAIIAFSIALWRPDFVEQIELTTLDQRFKMRGPIAADERIVIVSVDDDAISEIGRWPWSRDIMADLLDRIAGQYDAKTIAMDIVFSEAQNNPLAETVRLLEGDNRSNPMVTRWLDEHREVGDIDSDLETIFAKYHDRIVPGYFFYPMDATAPEMAKQRRDALGEQMRTSALTAHFTEGAIHSMPKMAALEGNLARFTQAADAVGYFNFFPDTDGTVRRVPLIAELDGFVYPSIDVQALRTYLDWPPVSVRIGLNGVEEIAIGERIIRADFTGSMLLNHYGPGYTFTHVSAADILKGRLAPDALKDKLVILGVTAVGVFDFRPSPFDTVFPGVEGHAAAMANLLNGNEISRPASLEMLELFGVLLLALLCGFMVRQRGPIVQSVAIIGVPLLLIYLSFWIFTGYGIWVKSTYLIMAVLISTLPVTLVEYFIESRKRAFIHDAFSRYLSPEVVEGLARRPEMLKLGGEKRHLTAMFSDIASFSTFSEKLSPEELVHCLNLYLTAMSDIILKHGGTLDKYEGDAIMAFFGAPVDLPDQATCAVLAALEQQQALTELRVTWSEMGLPPIHIRIGLNTGPMIVGNMGTATHMNYTIMGDDVNLASRLEGVCKVYRTPILMSKETYTEVRDTIAARFVDRVRVVGRAQPVDLYQPLGRRSDMADEDIAISRHYELAWKNIRERKFSEAVDILEKLHAQVPQDGLFEVMLTRAREYQRTPPPLEWDGVFNLTEK